MRLYLHYLSIHLKSRMQYKTSFILTILGQFLMSCTALLGLIFMMQRFHTIDGFTLQEVLLCFATTLMAFSLAECVARGFDLFPQMLSNGEFDRILVRPQGIIFQVLAQKMAFERLGRFLQALAVFIYAIPKSGVSWTVDKCLCLVLMIVCGAAVFFGLFLLYATFSFFTVEGLEFMNILTDGGREFGTYPYGIYGKNVLGFLTFIIPLALTQYYPLLYLLHRTQNVVYLFAPLGGLLFLIPTFCAWRFGLSKFRSTGS